VRFDCFDSGYSAYLPLFYLLICFILFYPILSTKAANFFAALPVKSFLFSATVIGLSL
jgi:hypothetical protein